MKRIIRKQARDNIDEHKAHYSRVLFWMCVIVLMVCNFIVAIALIPFFVVITSPFAYLVVAGLGLLFGYLFNLLLNDIEHLERHHHVIGIIFIPLLALVNLMIMTNVANTLSFMLKINVLHNPLHISALYSITFVFPYLITKQFQASCS